VELDQYLAKVLLSYSAAAGQPRLCSVCVCVCVCAHVCVEGNGSTHLQWGAWVVAVILHMYYVMSITYLLGCMVSGRTGL